MLCDDGGEKEWAQMMGERLAIPPANSSGSNNSSATCGGGGKSGVIRANSVTAVNASRVADKPPAGGAQDHLPPPPAALRCPRCDSSNTKFCYYNNYSLSQPRHFCKACKRYWTRGGTLRNVPVGGGCRKNKRSKKPPAAAPPPPIHAPIPPLSASRSAASHLDAAAAAAAAMFAMPILPGGLSASNSAFDLPPPPHQLSALGLGLGELHPLQAPETSAAAMSFTLLSDFPQLYGLSSSLLLPSISKPQPKQVEDYQVFLPFEELHASEMSGSTINGMMKEVKLESGQPNIINSCIDWQIPVENSLDSFAPPSTMYWNGGSAGWPDGGSSVAPPLI